MVVALNRSVPIAVKAPEPVAIRAEGPSAPQRGPASRRLRSYGKWIWHQLVIAFSGPGLGEGGGGIDDTAMPSGFMVPYKRGSSQVRNLWHEPF